MFLCSYSANEVIRFYYLIDHSVRIRRYVDSAAPGLGSAVPGLGSGVLGLSSAVPGGVRVISSALVEDSAAKLSKWPNSGAAISPRLHGHHAARMASTAAWAFKSDII